ncbi:Leucine-rich repeat receptor protein kinase ems1 [Thalictrum thalictroides]|uniref:Leucine-rich repeat receptor protein kinase ems1 n=1 Tax=Thalictrum thalictroides TaxID=46969 RepID=A0A7J6W3Y6_THATH|nr:Leucine-rich repeat receptor protein kinase ems1 [Thalictrum thalictroides]
MVLVFTSTPPHHLVLVVLVLLLISVFSPICFAKCHVDDEAGLLAFKSGITQDHGLLSSWIPGTDCCKWSGVRCLNTDYDRVTNLILYGDSTVPNGSLTGTISPSLFIKAQQLSRISIESHPNLTGTLPKEIFNLPNLVYISMRYTKLSGLLSIDDKTPKSTRFKQLSLVANQFTGPIPNSISQFTHLIALDLNDNKFSGGIPYGIRYLRKLVHMSLDNNQLSGQIPDIFSLFAFKELTLSYNKLSGRIPPSLSSLAPELVLFRASHNALTGRIPDYIANFKQLIDLDLSYNRLSGPIPKTKFPAESFLGNAGLCGSPLPPCKN